MQGITLMPRLTMKVIKITKVMPATRTMEATMNKFFLIANAVGAAHV